MKPPLRFRLIGVAFVLGAVEHTAGLVGMAFGWYMYAHYPWWRHATFASIDAGIAWMAFRQPERVFYPVLAFFLEQIATNGVTLWQSWTHGHRVQWPILGILVLIAVGVALSAKPPGGSRDDRLPIIPTNHA